MRRSEIDGLDWRRTYWIPAVTAPHRNWAGMPGCRSGARFMVDARTLRPSRDEFDPFDSKLSCLAWIMEHRIELNRSLPDAPVRAVPLDRWLLGLE